MLNKNNKAKLLWPSTTNHKSPASRNSTSRTPKKKALMPIPETLHGERADINVQNQNDSSQLYNVLHVSNIDPF